MKVVVYVAPPQFVFSSLLHILPFPNAFLQNTFPKPHKPKSKPYVWVQALYLEHKIKNCKYVVICNQCKLQLFPFPKLTFKQILNLMNPSPHTQNRCYYISGDLFYIAHITFNDQPLKAWNTIGDGNKLKNSAIVIEKWQGIRFSNPTSKQVSGDDTSHRLLITHVAIKIFFKASILNDIDLI